MNLITIVDEDFANYKKPSMFLIFPYCDFKCDKENGNHICQNSSLANEPTINVDIDKLCVRFLNNPITESIVCGGLEPLCSQNDLFCFIFKLRNDYGFTGDIVIYTGYTEQELAKFQPFFTDNHLIIKFGRFIPNEEKHYDEILGVQLASNNQYAKRF